jgi:leucyl aminopeptidase (aminopeptidase T)
VAYATAQAAFAIGARPTLLLYPTQPEAQMEPPPPVAGALARADVWIEYAVQYTLYTQARMAATAAGCRYACMSGMDVDMLVRTIGQVNYPKMIALGDELVRLIRAAREMRITSAEGTDLTAQLTPDVFQSGCIAHEEGALIMLGGQVGHLPVEETIEGTIVVDGEIWPPGEIGILDEPVELVIEQGSIKQVKGKARAETYQRWLAGFGDPNLYRMAHYAYGFNPGVSKLTGRIVEDERVFGSITFGFGSLATRKAASHTDCVVMRPTILIDGVEIERAGKYVHPDLVRLCRELGAPGY